MLDFTERTAHAPIYALHQDLLKLRHQDSVLSAQPRRRLEWAVLGTHAFVLRFLGENEDRLLLVNLGADLFLASAPEPLLAPASADYADADDEPSYGGSFAPRRLQTFVD